MQTIAHHQAQTILHLLKENNEHIQALSQLLQQEQELLKNRKRVELKPILQEKSSIIACLQQSEQRLQQTFHAIGAEYSQEGMEALLEKVPQPLCSVLKNLYSVLKQGLERCQHLNKVNEKVIQRSRHNIQAILSTLKGQETYGPTYRSDGAASNHCVNRLLAKA